MNPRAADSRTPDDGVPGPRPSRPRPSRPRASKPSLADAPASSAHLLPADPLADLASLVGPELAKAIERKAFTSLTPVQQAVLDPALEGRDLRVSSQTGSGKTVAIGFALRTAIVGDASPGERGARPLAMVIVPTRELAKQVQEELSWLYAPLGAKVASVAGGGGGGGYRTEMRAFREGPAVIVGTPGRLLDHLTRGAIDASQVAAVVLDEADRMLDMGFREDIEAILSKTPAERRTHLVSATFPREVRSLADRVQTDPARVEGTPLGTANADIAHVVHVVAPGERIDAIVNLLLATPGRGQSLLFVRTRADVADMAAALQDAGFACGMLSGDMEQPERTRALAAFKRGALDALVATDVAARGIDVQDVASVIHVEAPSDADAYTHRSGRTGRAGRKGTSAVLVAPHEVRRATRLLDRVGVPYRIAPAPNAAEILAAQDERMIDALTREDAGDLTPDARTLAVAERLVREADVTQTIARLITRARSSSGVTPRQLTVIEAPPARPSRPRAAPKRSAREMADRQWSSFRVSWGQSHGADVRRLLAMVCRRGNIQGSDVGSIRVARVFSTVEVASDVADAFEKAAREPDPRNPRVKIQPNRPGAGDDETRPTRPDRQERAYTPRDEAPTERAAETPSEARPPSPHAERPSTRSFVRDYKPKPFAPHADKPKRYGDAHADKPKRYGDETAAPSRDGAERPKRRDVGTGDIKRRGSTDAPSSDAGERGPKPGGWWKGTAKLPRRDATGGPPAPTFDRKEAKKKKKKG